MRVTSIKSEYVLSELMQLLLALSKIWETKVDYSDDELQLEYKKSITKSIKFEKQIRTFLLFSSWRKLRGRPVNEWVRVDIEKLLASLYDLNAFFESFTSHTDADEISFLYYYKKMEQLISFTKPVKIPTPEEVNFWILLHPNIIKITKSK